MNPYLGAVIGMIMINPSLQNAVPLRTEGGAGHLAKYFSDCIVLIW